MNATVSHLRPRTVPRATLRDWFVTLGLLGLNIVIAILILLGACDAMAWVIS